MTSIYQQTSLSQATREVTVSNGLSSVNTTETTWKLPCLTEDMKTMIQPFVKKFNQWIEGMTQVNQDNRNSFLTNLANLKSKSPPVS